MIVIFLDINNTVNAIVNILIYIIIIIINCMLQAVRPRSAAKTGSRINRFGAIAATWQSVRRERFTSKYDTAPVLYTTCCVISKRTKRIKRTWKGGTIIMHRIIRTRACVCIRVYSTYNVSALRGSYYEFMMYRINI